MGALWYFVGHESGKQSCKKCKCPSKEIKQSEEVIKETVVTPPVTSEDTLFIVGTIVVALIIGFLIGNRRAKSC